MRELVQRRLDNAEVSGGDGAHRRSGVTVNLRESALAWLRARGHVDARQTEAGERLRGDYERASIAPRVTMSWDPAPGQGKGRSMAPAMDPASTQFEAKRRFDRAIAAVGPGLSDVLWRVICADERLADAERALGWPSRAGKVVLCLALDRLADHYGLRR